MGMRISILAPIFILLLTGFWSVDEAQASVSKTKAKHFTSAKSSKHSRASAHVVKHKKSTRQAHKSRKAKLHIARKHNRDTHAAKASTHKKRIKVARLMQNHRETSTYHYRGPMTIGADGILAPSTARDDHWLAFTVPDRGDVGPCSLMADFGAKAPDADVAAEMVLTPAPGIPRPQYRQTAQASTESQISDSWLVKAAVESRDESTSEPQDADGLAYKVLETAYNYLGVRYRYGGTTPEGFDCSGFVRYVFSENGIQLGRSSRDQAQAGMHVPLSALKPGDLIFFNMHSRKHHRIDHVGLYIGDGQFIHAASSRSRQIMISDLKSVHYQNRVVTARRITSSSY